MKTTRLILIGDVLSGHEASFLRELVRSFPEPDTLILANFHVDQQQIDFFVVTPTHAGLIEHKHFTGPVFGEMNGAWQLIESTGNRVTHSGSSNPYNQALKQTYALSDAMKAYRKRASVPDADAGRYFRNFRTYVAIAPKIQPQSRVTSGDNKARILSADEVIERIRTTGHTSTWSLADWHAFAVEQLNLRPVSLEEAIDPQTLEAANIIERYRERAKSLIGSNLPPLIGATNSGEPYGATLVEGLIEGANVLLVGPAGSAKTFHLHHAAIAMFASDNELPILVEAKRYRGGDFWPFLRACLAPVFPGDPKHLIGATTVTGLRPVLLIDALNECPPALRDELLKGAVAFALQYEARTVITAQERVMIAGLAVDTLALSLPDAEQKRAIYAFHARVTPTRELDVFCGGFRNAYELTIAGRCHGATRPPMVALELYDRYVAECLPSRSPSVAGALVRHLAAEMSERGSLHLTRNDCETLASRFLAEHGAAPLTVLDDLLQSQLLDVSGDVVTFEHELLFKYLRSSALQRSAASLTEICAALRLPRYRELIEFILPRLSSRDEVDAVLNVCDSVTVLANAYDGMLGPLARSAVTDACDTYTRRAIAEVGMLDVHFELLPADDGRCRLIGTTLSGPTDLSLFETLIAELISLQDDEELGRSRIIAFIDRCEATLLVTVSRRAKEKRLNPRRVWSEVIRTYICCMGSDQPRITLVLSKVHQRLSSWQRKPLDPDLRSSLASRALAEPAGTIALYLLLEEETRSDADGESVFTLVERAWGTQLPHVQMTALHTLMNTRSAIDAAGAGLHSRVAEFLRTIEPSDLLLSTVIAEAQSHYEVIDAPVSTAEALSQMRETIAWSLPDELRDQFGETGQNEWAYSILSRIFEDVFQGAYYEAYHELTDDERLQILTLAAGTPNMGFSGSWVMHELRGLERVEALPAFRKAATKIDLTSPFSQDTIAVFVLAIHGFSKYAEAPPMREAPKTPLERAWFIIADALFWAFHDDGRHATARGSRLLKALEGDDLLAAAAVLADLDNSRSKLTTDDRALLEMETVYPDDTRRILTAALRHRDEIRKLYSRFGRDFVLDFVVRALGDIGDAGAIPALREAMDDTLIGRPAIKAIQAIEARAVGIDSLAK